jgi:hypothetical protein
MILVLDVMMMMLSSLSILAIEATRLHIIIAQVIHANFKLSQSVIDSLFPLQFLTLG